MKSTAYNFFVSEDENSAVNRTSEIQRGDRSKINKAVPIEEGDPGVIAVVDVLKKCLEKDSDDVLIGTLWLVNLSRAGGRKRNK